jgi:ABC-type phosphate transport system permease subunit
MNDVNDAIDFAYRLGCWIIFYLVVFGLPLAIMIGLYLHKTLG